MALVKSISVKGYPGLNFVSHDELKYARVLTVTREGMGYDLTDATPGNRQAKHTTSTGKIEFEQIFIGQFILSGSRPRLQPLESVNITYER